MEVLHLDTGRELRGGQRQALLLMDELRSRGVPQFLLARHDGALLPVAMKRGHNAAALSPWRLHRESMRCDLVHCHDARSHTIAALLLRRPFVVSRRVGFPPGDGPLDRWKYGRAALYIAVSRFVADRLRAIGVDASRIEVVHDGVVVPERPSDNTGGVVALEMTDPLKSGDLLATLQVPLMRTNDLESHLPSARVFLYVTSMEGLGSAALAAMAHGVPVVASAVGGLPEIVREGETGLLVPNESEAIDTALRRMLDDPEAARAMGMRGRDWVKSNCTSAIMAERTLAIHRRFAA